MKDAFRKVSAKVSGVAGTAGAFVGALVIVLVWALTGPVFDFSNTWQLFINTGTTIVTFLMVFLIQNTQNRDSKAMQLKLDELIIGSKGASDKFVDLEDLTDEDLAELDEEFKRLHNVYANNPNHSIHKLHHKIATAHAKRQKGQKASS